VGSDRSQTLNQNLPPSQPFPQGKGQTPDGCARGNGEEHPQAPPLHSDPALAALQALPAEEYQARYAAAEAVLRSEGVKEFCLVRSVVETKMLELLATLQTSDQSPVPSGESGLTTDYTPHATADDGVWMAALGAPWWSPEARAALERGPPANAPRAAEGGAP